MTLVRGLVLALVVAVAVTLQVSVFSFVSVDGVTPDLALIVVVAAAFARGSQFAAVLGFFAGLLVDLAPPADHVAGRWALAFVVVGYLAGRVRSDARGSTLVALTTVAACSFVGTSIYAISGLVLHDGGVAAGQMPGVIAVSVVGDLVIAPFLLPLLLVLFRRLRPPQMAY